MIALALRIARALPDVTIGTLIVIVHGALLGRDRRSRVTRTPAPPS